MKLRPGPEVLPQPDADIHPAGGIAADRDAVHVERLRHRTRRSCLDAPRDHLAHRHGRRSLSVEHDVKPVLTQLPSRDPGEAAAARSVQYFELERLTDAWNLIGRHRWRRQAGGLWPEDDRRNACRGEQDSSPAQRDPADEGVTREFQKRTVGSGNVQPD